MDAEEAVAERPIVNWLRNPETTITPSQILEHWAAQSIEVSVPRPSKHVTPLELAGRIRRAWGARLRRGASDAGHDALPCTWDPPCARDIFFEEQFRFSPRHGLPKPYVFAVDVHRNRLDIRLTLFGIGIDYAYAAREALVEALRYGVDWTGPEEAGRAERARTPILASVMLAPALSPVPAGDRVILEFLTPLKLGGEDPLSNPATVLARAARRSGNMLAWMGLRLNADWRSLADIWQRAECAVVRADAVASELRSRRQNVRYRAEGNLMTIAIEGDSLAYWPFLAACETCHVGTGASVGFGRFRLLT